MVRTISKMLGPVQRQLRLLVGRAVINLVNDSLKVQGLQVQLLADEVRDDVERFQEYGYTSNPHPGAEAIVVAVGGSRNHGIVIACEDRRYRLTGLEAGEVALYDDLGQVVHLKRDRLLVKSPTLVEIDAPTCHMTGDLNVDKSITATMDVRDQGGSKSMAGMRGTFNAHTHPGDSGGTTGTPTGSM